MFCTNCGTENRDGAAFCWQCGNKILIPKKEEEEKASDSPLETERTEAIQIQAQSPKIKGDETLTKTFGGGWKGGFRIGTRNVIEETTIVYNPSTGRVQIMQGKTQQKKLIGDFLQKDISNYITVENHWRSFPVINAFVWLVLGVFCIFSALDSYDASGYVVAFMIAIAMVIYLFHVAKYYCIVLAISQFGTVKIPTLEPERDKNEIVHFLHLD